MYRQDVAVTHRPCVVLSYFVVSLVQIKETLCVCHLRESQFILKVKMKKTEKSV